MNVVKRVLRSLAPSWLLELRKKRVEERLRKKYAGLSTREVFTRIYEDGDWGRSESPDQRYYSGSGSHDPAVVDAYVEAITRFLASLPAKPNVVDLGCGDFSVGERVRMLCDRYIACDIVEPVIAYNKEKYRDRDVDFRVLDLTSDELPDGEVAFIRQVLQHLSNAQILAAIPKIARKYRYLVLSEHLPGTPGFTSNADKPAGPDTRIERGSGLVLTDPPFNLKPLDEVRLCEVKEFGGIIRTTLYRLA